MLQNNNSSIKYDLIFQKIAEVIQFSRQAAVRTVNAIITATYWEIGIYIVEFEQDGETRASYGKGLLEQLSVDLKARFGRWFSLQNLQQMRQFYLIYNTESICQTLSSKLDNANNNTQITANNLNLQDIAQAFPLSWSHYVLLLTLKNNDARMFYESESLRGEWSVRQLDRQISSQFYERALLSRNKAAMLNKGSKALPEDFVSPEEEIKNPVVLEFLNLKVF